jgi:molybdenum cofactor synthesis domain-containing protein
VIGTEVIPDERELIAGRLCFWADDGGCELILTTGGTGFSIDDVTPEATRDVIDREAPGIGEAMRLASRQHTEMWMTSRGIAGTRGRALIVNFPGNPPAIEQAGAAIEKALPHVLSLLAG